MKQKEKSAGMRIRNSFLSNKVVKNASWIIVCKIAEAIFSLIIGVLTARYLGPSNYGLINYAASLVAFAIPIMQLGLANIMVRELVHNSEKEGEILGTALILSVVSSILCMASLAIFVFFINAGETETIVVCILYSIILFFRAFELLQYWFQAKLLSKYTSIVALLAFLCVSAYKTYLLITKKSIYWFSVSNALDYFLIAIALFCIYKKMGGQKLFFSAKMAKNLFSESRYYIVSSLMVTIFGQTDKIMLKLMIDESETGYYSAAMACAGMATFIFTAILDSARPIIFESEKKTRELYELNLKRLYCVIIYLSIAVCLGTVIFARFGITILYGSAYIKSVGILQVLVWYTTFSYLGSVRNIWILAEGKQNFLWIINLSGAICNVVLNYILIPSFGAIGAAAASVITNFFANVVIGFIIKPIRENNKLLINSINPKYILDLFKRGKNKMSRKKKES